MVFFYGKNRSKGIGVSYGKLIQISFYSELLYFSLQRS